MVSVQSPNYLAPTQYCNATVEAGFPKAAGSNKRRARASARCQYPGCMTARTFGREGDRQASFCAVHKEEGNLLIHTCSIRSYLPCIALGFCGVLRRSNVEQYCCRLLVTHVAKNGVVAVLVPRGVISRCAASLLPSCVRVWNLEICLCCLLCLRTPRPPYCCCCCCLLRGCLNASVVYSAMRAPQA